MRGQKDFDIFFAHNILEKGISYLPRGFLKTFARFPRDCGDFRTQNVEFNSVHIGKCAAKILVTVGFLASYAVIYVGNRE